MEGRFRPGRITAALGLMILGAVLLAEHLTGARYLPALLRLWPLLLVGLGIELLLLGRGNHVGVDLGGLMVLVIVAAVVGQAVPGRWPIFFPDLGLRVQIPAYGPARYTHEQTVVLDGVEELSLLAEPARLEVVRTGGDEVRVTLRVVGAGLTPEEARERAQQVKLETRGDRSAEVSVSWTDPVLRVAEMTVVAEVPDTVRTVKARVAAGAVRVEGIAAALDVQADAGSVRILDPGGDVSVRTDSGLIHLATGRVAGHYRLRADTGAVQVELPRGADVQVDVRVDTGIVSAPAWVEVRKGRAVGKQGAGTYRLQVETDSGAVRIAETDA